MRVSIIGSGYVGLVAGACLSKLGNKVIFIDTDRKRTEAINSGVCPIHEQGIDEMLSQVHIEATPDYSGIIDSDLIFLCTGTPSNRDGSILLKHVVESARQIAGVLREGKGNYCVIVVKSTIVPGTTEEFIIPILESSGRKPGDDFGICVNPEFLREGKAIYDFMNPARIIIGEYDSRSGDFLSSLYKGFDAPILRTDLRTAEMIKLASNVFLAAKLSLINEIGNICKQLGIDTRKVAEGMGFDNRIGNQYLDAGLGYGGSCLPKDIRALIAKSKQIGYKPRILEEISKLNNIQALRAVELLKKHISLKGTSIGLLGLAFKPGTDDIRESRAINIVQSLLEEGAIVKAYDPVAMANFRELFSQIAYVSKEEILDCDAVIIITEWEEFNNLDYKNKIVIDGRGVPKAKEARVYEGICW